MLNRKGRKSDAGSGEPAPIETATGNRGLQVEEALIFEIGKPEASGVDLPDPPAHESRLGGLERKQPIGLPGLSEPEALRHYVRLSQKNYAIDLGLYPLGSCTMKHNPRLNEKMARLDGFADIHPLQPGSTVQGALELIDTLAKWLAEITGAAGVAMSPKAGAHGELCGMMAIRAAHEAAGNGDQRRKVLVPESAHGTNPATASLLGYSVVDVEAREDGTVAAETVREKLDDSVAAIMLTNPNTCGLFERDGLEIAQAVHDAGAYFYCDGANLNALVGKARAIEMGVDAMHINLHKTFSTPHGGGGPGAGPTVFSSALAPFAPLPFVRETDGAFELVEHEDDAGDARPFGRMAAFHGQMGMFVRALSFMMSHGADGLRQVAEDAVLNANYLRVGLRDVMSQPFGDRICMHEVLFDDQFLKDTGVATLDFAKAMIDEGYHPMTMYFPLVVHGAMLIEPTESESKLELDRFIDMMRALIARVNSGDAESFAGAPYLAPRRRLDETQAAREPRLVWSAQDSKPA